jgi:DNA-binding GntR family transcriptional regulator
MALAGDLHQSRAGKTKRASVSVHDIYERMVTAIIEHRLPPGTQLVEEKLAAVFGVGRSRIRTVLARLAHEKLVLLQRNRGAFVASPSVEQAREVFGARRLLEPELARLIIERVTQPDIGRLREHVSKEQTARTADDRRAIIRLSGEFHVLMAQIVGNTFVTEMLQELTSLTCLIIVLYDSPALPACPHNEHADIVDAIERRDGETAARLMLAHLDHVESSLHLVEQESGEIDLEAVFAGV